MPFGAGWRPGGAHVSKWYIDLGPLPYNGGWVSNTQLFNDSTMYTGSRLTTQLTSGFIAVGFSRCLVTPPKVLLKLVFEGILLDLEACMGAVESV